MQVLWDPRKAVFNVRKHNVSFEEASTVFADSLAMTSADPDHSIGQARWITFGESARGRLLAVAHVEEGDIIRIIISHVTARPEKRFYEEG